MGYAGIQLEIASPFWCSMVVDEVLLITHIGETRHVADM